MSSKHASRVRNNRQSSTVGAGDNETTESRSRASTGHSSTTDDSEAVSGCGAGVPVPVVTTDARKRAGSRPAAPPLTSLLAPTPRSERHDGDPLMLNVPGLHGRDTTHRPQSTSRSGRSVRRVNLASKALIGKGSYGMVFQAMDRDTNRIIAVKEIPLTQPPASSRGSGSASPAKSASPALPSRGSFDSGDKRLEAVHRELEVMRHLDHPNIVRYLGDEVDDGYLRIFMEFVSGGSVSSLLKTFGPFQERQASSFTRQMLQGLVYLHAKGVAHGDLKGDNLLVDTLGNLKLADFGGTKMLPRKKGHRSSLTDAIGSEPSKEGTGSGSGSSGGGVSEGGTGVMGTAYYLAPEVVQGEAVDEAADVWSLGCCVIEMLTGRPPLASLPNQFSVMMHIAQSKGELVDEYIPASAGWTPEAVRFVSACLQRSPAARPSAAELLLHPWIQAPTNEDNIPSPAKVTSTNVVLEDYVPFPGDHSPLGAAGRRCHSHSTTGAEDESVRSNSTASNTGGNHAPKKKKKKSSGAALAQTSPDVTILASSGDHEINTNSLQSAPTPVFVNPERSEYAVPHSTGDPGRLRPYRRSKTDFVEATGETSARSGRSKSRTRSESKKETGTTGTGFLPALNPSARRSVV